MPAVRPIVEAAPARSEQVVTVLRSPPGVAWARVAGVGPRRVADHGQTSTTHGGASREPWNWFGASSNELSVSQTGGASSGF
jgi:hypothetical protein